MAQPGENVYELRSKKIPQQQPQEAGITSLEPVLPSSQEAERYTLGAIFLDDANLAIARAIIEANDFLNDLHRETFKACISLADRGDPIDLVSVKDELVKTRVLDPTDIEYLVKLTDGIAYAMNVEHWCRIIRGHSLRRQMIQSTNEFSHQAFDLSVDEAELADQARMRFSEIAERLDETSGLPTFKSAIEIISEPPAVEIVQDIILEQKITVLTAESTTGKTFVGLSIGAAVDTGKSWLGRSVKRGSVAYVSYEGDDLARRLLAMNERQGYKMENLYFLPARDPISPIIDNEHREISSPGAILLKTQLMALRDRLARENKPPIRLLVIDTVRASLNGSEDSSQNVSEYLRAVRGILALIPKAGAMLIHHTGWEGKRERGSSSFRGNVEITLILNLRGEDPVRGVAYLALVNPKIRDEAKTEPLGFIRRQVSVNRSDPRGEPLTSCIIEADFRSSEEREAEIEAAEEAENRVIDLKALKAIAKKSSMPTSKEGIAIAIKARRETAREITARLEDRGWLQPPDNQRQPYTITDAGKAAIQEASSRTK